MGLGGVQLPLGDTTPHHDGGCRTDTRFSDKGLL